MAAKKSKFMTSHLKDENDSMKTDSLEGSEGISPNSRVASPKIAGQIRSMVTTGPKIFNFKSANVQLIEE